MIWKGDDQDAWRILIAIILSSNVHDRNVELSIPGLFSTYPDVFSLAEAEHSKVEQLIRSTGYYRQKAIAIIATSKSLVDNFQGKVPSDLDDLLSLRGVGRKTANAVRSIVFEIPSLVVDTHVVRVSNRLGLVDVTHPYDVERALSVSVTSEYWRRASHLFVLLGRDFCQARKPSCKECPVVNLCKRRLN